MRISDWSSDVCSSDLGPRCQNQDKGSGGQNPRLSPRKGRAEHNVDTTRVAPPGWSCTTPRHTTPLHTHGWSGAGYRRPGSPAPWRKKDSDNERRAARGWPGGVAIRSEENKSELQAL